MNESPDQSKRNPVRYNAIGLIRNSGPWENHGAIKLRRTFKALSFLTRSLLAKVPMPATARNADNPAGVDKFLNMFVISTPDL